MTRRLLSACVGAALVGMLSVPVHGIAKPPDLPEDGTFTATWCDTPPGPRCQKPSDLPEDGTFTATPVMSPPSLLFQLRPTARRTFAGSLLFGIHPALTLLPTDKVLDAPCDHPHSTADDLLAKLPKRAVQFSVGPDCRTVVFEEIDCVKWFLFLTANRCFTTTSEENDGSVTLLNSDSNVDATCDHPQCAANENMLTDVPVPSSVPIFWTGPDGVATIYAEKEGDWLKWLLSHWTARQQPPPPEQNEGYIHAITAAEDFAYRAIHEPPASENETPAPAIEMLPMPHEEADITCPYLRQQMIDRHACQIADPEIGRDVLDNLERLKEADELLELAKELARDGFLGEAMVCCDQAAKLCPGSPCAERAVDTLHELACGIVPPVTDTEEAAEQQAEASSSEPGVEQLVSGLMKACHLLMSQGMQHQAAELARQAYALDPQRVVADPLIYKMHLLAESPAEPPAGSTEESEPPTCPYCPRIGKPIREIVPEKKKKSEDASQTKP